MSKDLIQALEDIIDPIGAMQRDLQDGYQLNGHEALRQINSREFYVNLAKQALSRHRSSVESVELPRGDGECFTYSSAEFPCAPFNSIRWASGMQPPPPGTQLYTASTVRSLIAAAVERATEEANRRANASWSLMVEKMVAIEREECAKVCDSFSEKTLKAQSGKQGDLSDIMLRQVAILGHQECAAAIRARGEK